MTRKRRQELCDKIEALLREYGDILEVGWDDYCEEHEQRLPPTSAPDWQHPMAIQHWALVLTVDDSNADVTERGYWMFALSPPLQRPYITRGVLEEWLSEYQ